MEFGYLHMLRSAPSSGRGALIGLHFGQSHYVNPTSYRVYGNTNFIGKVAHRTGMVPCKIGRYWRPRQRGLGSHSKLAPQQHGALHPI